ncbi:HAD family hydrolase [Crateriforma conspicua]|uniref:Haloacid dehalogenase-like hydrolase n=1 Tax=Crateriforma conspicua TaxID=2527996 RepID=A0A5C5Y1Z9_9PLAN|nr:HAD family hydrolase [Crateriforma conspicua]TWT69018.1 haloacid dehalogenase-like hydrolase [Crateriforma conspicua]
MPPLSTLLIDIDDTLVHQSDVAGQTYPLLELIKQQAAAQGLATRSTLRAIQDVLDAVYWTWSDFLAAVGVDPVEFWLQADLIESRRTTVLDPQISARLARLQQAGYRLCITSNNPVDGIRHKLRLAGFDSQTQQNLFMDFFGTNNCRANKGQVQFWRCVVGQLRVAPETIAVIGDNPIEDGQIPSTVGINRWFPIGTNQTDHPADCWAAAERQLLDHRSSNSTTRH